MKKGYDVIIIGGGIIGCSIAFELAKRGVTDILLVEKGFLTSGATGRCGAGIRQQWGHAGPGHLVKENGLSRVDGSSDPPFFVDVLRQIPDAVSMPAHSGIGAVPVWQRL